MFSTYNGYQTRLLVPMVKGKVTLNMLAQNLLVYVRWSTKEHRSFIEGHNSFNYLNNSFYGIL
jgi:hypothetical protein